jgi:hypothetical protein
MRMTFLVSDGPYFGEGPPAKFLEDRCGAPVVMAALELVQVAVKIALTQNESME